MFELILTVCALMGDYEVECHYLRTDRDLDVAFPTMVECEAFEALHLSLFVDTYAQELGTEVQHVSTCTLVRSH